MYRHTVKPFFDLASAFAILVVLAPVILLTMIALLLANNGKIWFKQERPGKNGKLFRVLKFKTMTDRCGADGELLPDRDRLTGVGKIIRQTSVDELPQLINVLRREMSIVGPRPLLKEYLPLYSDFQRRRHEIKPGITGWAQVNGRNTVEWPKRFEYDVWYVDHQSFWLDLKILLLTFIKVFKAEGIGSLTSETMEPFRGNN